MKTFIAIALMILVAACGNKKTEKCSYNGVDMPCDEYREMMKPKPTPSEQAESVEVPREGVEVEVLRTDCFKVVNDANFSTVEAEAVCINANPYSQNCVEEALKISLLRSDIATICANAREGSTTCLYDARIKDQKYSEEIAHLCK